MRLMVVRIHPDNQPVSNPAPQKHFPPSGGLWPAQHELRPRWKPWHSARRAV